MQLQFATLIFYNKSLIKVKGNFALMQIKCFKKDTYMVAMLFFLLKMMLYFLSRYIIYVL